MRLARMLWPLFAAAPVGFALIRAIRTGSDLRYVWMAAASFVGSAVVMVAGAARRRSPTTILAVSALAAGVGALLAGGTAFLVGARSVTSVAVVAGCFGFCWGASLGLRALSRRRVT